MEATKQLGGICVENHNRIRVATHDESWFDRGAYFFVGNSTIGADHDLRNSTLT